MYGGSFGDHSHAVPLAQSTPTLYICDSLVSTIDIDTDMAHHKSALKRIRQTRTHMLYNRVHKKAMREAVKAVRLATDASVAREALTKAFSILDRAAAKGVIKTNTAANRKSSLALHVRKLENA